MRLHITLDDDLVRSLDERVEPRKRSAFIATALKRALDDDWRWSQIEKSLGSIAETGHEWDLNPASWVRDQRRDDPARLG